MQRKREHVPELCALECEHLGTLRHLVELAEGAFALVLETARAVLRLAQKTLRALHGGTRVGNVTTHFVLRLLMFGEFRLGLPQLRLHTGAIGGCRLPLRRDPRARLLASGGLRFGALAARARVALPFFCDGHLGANALHLIAVCVHETRQLVALCLGGGACAMRHFAGQFCRRHARLRGGKLLSQFGNANVKAPEFLAPRFHRSCRE